MPASNQLSLETVSKRIQDVSSLPMIVTRVLRVVNDERSSVNDLKGVVESDPALSVRVLRVVNSASYALRSPVTTIHSAISLLGFNTVRDLSLTLSVTKLFRDGEGVGSYRRRDLWRHLVCVAVASRMVAARSGYPRYDEAFLAGLLHDIGIILIDQYAHPEFVEIMRLTATGRPYQVVEKEMLGFDHAELGASVTRRWHFAPGVVDAILNHHDGSACMTENRELACVVDVANFLCSAKGITSTGHYHLSPPNPETFATLSLSREDIEVLWADLESELERSRPLLEIHVDGSP